MNIKSSRFTVSPRINLYMSLLKQRFKVMFSSSAFAISLPIKLKYRRISFDGVRLRFRMKENSLVSPRSNKPIYEYEYEYDER